MRKWSEIIEDLEAEFETGLARTRKVGNTLIPFLKGDTIIQTANRIFGHSGWSITPQGPVERFEIGTHTKNSIESVTFTYTIPVLCEFHGLLDDGTIHTIRKGDVGKNSTYSSSISEHEMAISGCATDALKRSMRHLGNQFGLTLYDKDSEDFKAVMAAANAGATGTGTRRSSAKKKSESKRKADARKKREATAAKKKKKEEEEAPKESPAEVREEMWDRAMAYVLPEQLKINGKLVDVPEGGETVKKVINMTIAKDLFPWLAGIRSSPNDLPPYEANNAEEKKMQLALYHILSESELSAFLNEEELAIVRGE